MVARARERIWAMALTTNDVDRFEAARPRLEAIAYRLLGSASEAEDAVQETFLRWQAADVERIEVLRGLADEGPHQPVPQPAHFGPRAARDLCGPVAPRAAARRGPDARPGRHRRAARVGLVRGPHPAGAPRRPTSGRCTCCGRRSTTRTGRSPRSSTSPRPPASRSSTAPGSTSRTARRAPGSTRPPPGGSSTSSSPPPPAAGPSRWCGCSPRTPSAIGDGGGKIPARASAFEGALAVATFLRGLFRPGEAKRALIGGSPEVHATTANGEPGRRGGRGRPGRRRHVPGGHRRGHRRPPQPGQPRQARTRDRAVGGRDHGEPRFHAL